MALRTVSVPFVLAAALWLSAPDLIAQTLTLPAPRQARGLFGRAPKGDGFDVSISTFKGFDDDQSGDSQPGIAPLNTRPQTTGGQFDGLDVTALFVKQGRHLSFGASERSGVRYYPGLEDLVGLQHVMTGGFSASYDRTHVTVMQSVGFAPFYSFSTLPMLVEAQPTDAPVSPDQVLVRRPSLTLTTSGSLSQTFGRASLSMAASTQRTDYTEEAATAMRSDSAFGRLLYHFTRDLGIVAGYGMQRGHYAVDLGSAETFEFHNIEFGLDYNHALSLTRRTKVGFATGATAVDDSSGSAGYRLVGDARISREFGRSWLATGSYRRGVGLIAGFSQPIFADSVAMSVTGLASPRLSVSANGGYSVGEVTSLRTGNHNDNFSASGQLQFALTRAMALTGALSYYRYRFDSTEGLPIGIQPRFDRRSARIGLSLWLPLFR